MTKKENYFTRALLAPLNLIALAGIGIYSAITMDTTPLMVAGGVELVYLAAIPRLPVFRRRIQAQNRQLANSESQQEFAALLEALPASQKNIYLELGALRDQIAENYKRMPGGPVLLDSSIQQVDSLTASFLRLLSTLNNYRNYLNSTDRGLLEKELAELRADVTTAEGNEKLKEVKGRRIEIITKRLERYDLAAENRELLSHQLASIEDFIRLLHEQSITLRDPDILGAQLNQISSQIQSTDDTVREMERFSAFVEEINPPSLPQRVR